ncbi:MAG: hypothetical protein AAFU71_17350 [Cyanobacteria bacterium J06632_22]
MDAKQLQAAYGSYPLTSTVILLVVVLVALILFKPASRAVKGFSGFCQRLLPAFGVVILGLIVNLMLAFSIQSNLQAVATLAPISSTAGLRELGADRVAVFIGTVSEQNERTSKGDKEYVAYLGEDSWRPLSLVVENQGDAAFIRDRNYVPLNWPRYRDPFGDNSVRYLDYGQPIVAIGEVLATTDRPLAGSNAEASYGIDTRVLFAGSYANFTTATALRALWPRIMLGLNSAALGVVVIGVLVSGSRRLMRRQPNSKPTQ